ncbi:MAG: glycosyltransferase [Chitinophagaceae bacterium]
MKKILYVSYDGMTDPLGQSQVLPYLEGLSQVGYQFTLLSFEKKDAFSQFSAVVKAKCEKAGIEWVPLEFHTRPPVVAKIIDRRKLFSKARRLHREKHFDLVHCRSYIPAELGLYLKKKYGVKFLFDMRGFWADEKAESGHWDQGKWFYRKLYHRYKKLEEEFVSMADHIISLTEAGKKELGRLYDSILKGKNESINSKCTVIPCCADLSHFDFNKSNTAGTKKLKNSLGIPNGVPVLSYSGSLGAWYMVDEMLQFFKAFRQQYPGAFFLVLTREVERLKEAMQKNKVDPGTVVIGFSSYKQLPLYLSVSNYSLFFIKPIYSKIASSPTKHAELMGMGIPVFCNDIGDTGFFLRKYPLGELVDTGTKNFSTALNNMDKKTISKDAIRAVASEYFDVQVGVQRYSAVYGKMLASNK